MKIYCEASVLVSCYFLFTVFSSILYYGVQTLYINLTKYQMYRPTQTYTLRINGVTFCSTIYIGILTNYKCFYFWIICAGLKPRIKVTLHNAEYKKCVSLPRELDGVLTAAVSVFQHLKVRTFQQLKVEKD